MNFGNPERFQVSLTWLEQDEPVLRQPRHYGWSMGSLVLTVAGENLMAHRVGEHAQDRFIWYLGPLLHWLTDNWVAVFHEEHFPWPERSEEAAATVCNRAIARLSSVGSAMARSLAAAEAWYRRHALTSAASGGLIPDIFLRRFGDDVEISWTAAPPLFAPAGFTFETEPGLARLAVSDVAEPLWELLSWVRENPPAMESQTFVADWQTLAAKIAALEHIAIDRFNAADVAEALLARVRASFQASGREDLLNPEIADGAPYVIAEAPAVAMFGGLTVDLSDADIGFLRDTLIGATNGEASLKLRGLMTSAPIRGKPWQGGYDLAEDFLDRLEEDQFSIAPEGYIDVRAICRDLDIVVTQERLETDEIRGVALAGRGFSTSILVNTRSAYNQNEDGRRFTIAHELCHILHDQSRARRLAHASGPWASPGVEKRANAFAAWLLMPPRLLQRYIPSGVRIDAERLREIASAINVADNALAEHLFNLSRTRFPWTRNWLNRGVRGGPHHDHQF